MTAQQLEGALPAKAAQATREPSLFAMCARLVRNRALREPDPKDVYGCVDWFCYPAGQAPECPAHPR